MSKRKLINFCTPHIEDLEKRYIISFSYYDENGKPTGKRERATPTEEELYDLLKPILKETRH